MKSIPIVAKTKHHIRIPYTHLFARHLMISSNFHCTFKRTVKRRYSKEAVQGERKLLQDRKKNKQNLAPNSIYLRDVINVRFNIIYCHPPICYPQVSFYFLPFMFESFKYQSRVNSSIYKF